MPIAIFTYTRFCNWPLMKKQDDKLLTMSHAEMNARDDYAFYLLSFAYHVSIPTSLGWKGGSPGLDKCFSVKYKYLPNY